MTDVSLIDVSLRDGNQSVWGAVGVTNRTIEKMSPLLDRCGYHAIEILTSTLIAVAVRFHREDPWARLDLARRLAPQAKLGFLTTGHRFITFSKTPKSILQLAYTLLRKHGITRIWIADPMLNMDATKENARIAKEAGFEEVVAGACYTLSPVHTNEFFADKLAELDNCSDIDSIYIKDPSGLLTPQRLEILLPILRSRLKRLKIDEIHTHCNTGLAPITLLTAADLGLTKLHCALPPVANGSSHSNALQLVRNLKARGHNVDVDLSAMEAASTCLKREATLFNLPSGSPVEYDEAYYTHTLPGGVLTTTRRQLAELGKAALLPRVIEEAVRVREDLGWPIVVTPFAQYIVTQASINVITGDRYSRITDEIVELLRGDFGPMPGKISEDLLERASRAPRARQPRSSDDEPSLNDIRRKFGTGLSDEDLLLRAVMPAEQVDAMTRRRAAGNNGLNTLLDALRDDSRPLSISMHICGATFSASGNKEGRLDA